MLSGLLSIHLFLLFPSIVVGEYYQIIGDSVGQHLRNSFPDFCTLPDGKTLQASNGAVGGSKAEDWGSTSQYEGFASTIGSAQCAQCSVIRDHLGVFLSGDDVYNSNSGCGSTCPSVVVVFIGSNDTPKAKKRCNGFNETILITRVKSAVKNIRNRVGSSAKIVLMGYCQHAGKGMDQTCVENPISIPRVLNKVAADAADEGELVISVADSVFSACGAKHITHGTLGSQEPVESGWSNSFYFLPNDVLHLNYRGQCKVFTHPDVQGALGCVGTPPITDCDNLPERAPGNILRTSCFFLPTKDEESSHGVELAKQRHVHNVYNRSKEGSYLERLLQYDSVNAEIHPTCIAPCNAYQKEKWCKQLEVRRSTPCVWETSSKTCKFEVPSTIGKHENVLNPWSCKHFLGGLIDKESESCLDSNDFCASLSLEACNLAKTSEFFRICDWIDDKSKCVENNFRQNCAVGLGHILTSGGSKCQSRDTYCSSITQRRLCKKRVSHCKWSRSDSSKPSSKRCMGKSNEEFCQSNFNEEKACDKRHICRWDSNENQCLEDVGSGDLTL